MSLPRSSYLVCATHRSGSNLLCMGLWHSDLAGRPQEFFSPTREESLSQEYGLTPATKSYVAYLRDLLIKRQTENGIFGSKIMWKHLQHLQDSLLADPTFLGPRSEDPWQLLQASLPQPRCLWMRRRNKVRQAISMVKAKQTKIYNTMQLQERAPVNEPVYDFAAIDKEFRRFEKEDELWLEFFQKRGIDYKEVVYEDFAQNYEGTIAALLDWLEIPRPNPLGLRSPDYQPQSDGVNQQWEQRYREQANL